MNRATETRGWISKPFSLTRGIHTSLRPWAVIFCLLLAVSLAANVHAATEAIASKTAEVDGLKLHYLTSGHGPAVILLHGYTQTSRMWRPIIPLL